MKNLLFFIAAAYSEILICSYPPHNQYNQCQTVPYTQPDTRQSYPDPRCPIPVTVVNPTPSQPMFYVMPSPSSQSSPSESYGATNNEAVRHLIEDNNRLREELKKVTTDATSYRSECELNKDELEKEKYGWRRKAFNSLWFFSGAFIGFCFAITCITYDHNCGPTFKK